MMRTTTFSVCLLLLTGTAAFAQKKQLVLKHKGNVAADKSFVMTREGLNKLIRQVPEGRYVLLSEAGRPLLVQHDDVDGDGRWDEIAFLLPMKAHEQKTLNISFGAAPAAIKAVVRAHVRHRRKNADDTFAEALSVDSIPAGQPATDFSKQKYPPFLTEGPAWENDKVGFRIYFDVRNNKDIWGKTTPAMVLDEVGADASKSYHNRSDWGMDILKVGKSLGAGALALQVKDKDGKDTLVRLGNANMGPVKYRKIADGPLRATFEMTYPAWKVLEGVPPVSLTEQITIWAGEYRYLSKVTVKGAPEGAKLVTGIVNLYNQQAQYFDKADDKLLYTYGVQSENKDNLGLALMVPEKTFSHYITAPDSHSEILNTYAVAQSLGEGAVQFLLYACWEPSDARFASAASFRKFLEDELDKQTIVEVFAK